MEILIVMLFNNNEANYEIYLITLGNYYTTLSDDKYVKQIKFDGIVLWPRIYIIIFNN